jgi:hypothetical protein
MGPRDGDHLGAFGLGGEAADRDVRGILRPENDDGRDRAGRDDRDQGAEEIEPGPWFPLLVHPA